MERKQKIIVIAVAGSATLIMAFGLVMAIVGKAFG